MKAAIWHGKKDVRVEETDLPEPKENEVRVKVAYAGICGSDLHEYLEGPVFIPTEFPDPLTGGQAPITMGHEFSGQIDQVGTNVHNFKIGDHVSVNPTITKGELPDNVDVYDGYSFIGLSTDGGFASYVNVPVENLYPLPKDFSLKLAAVIEPTAVAVQAIKEAHLTFGQTVVIFGAGPIGAMVTAAAKAAGATKIVVVDLSAVRLQKALAMGATDIINPSEVSDVLAAVHQILPEGADTSFEIAGVQATFDQAIKTTKARGYMVVVSIYALAIQFNPMALTNSGVNLTSTIAYSRQTFQQTVDLVTSGQINVAPIITSEIKLDDIITDGFDVLTTDQSQAKILINLTQEK
ncbi:2,3-butanediol dehydrogenase [Fructobacillus evanidus]|uniref:Threonine dehydrogenase or Mannitol dehydrogenase (Mdh) n=1 Tax=Fructobacillus evanidus TaxID=3064281 RepID=A0ABM9MW96_9LACO|nr:Threonine dehydrogenase or Mannitol dehydrogenase (mdh) [Fructobacillus sp. LMG 32999]CAK1229672.1 Threonine dehydrogenase or Mannitol dehydrogenase (mdh) [Fructobacillus sp. LMG 32999]CAK1232453.1 Threonine dehydrogenase or Mannitol dehydrogenase (mdh) [Fructobacillus sp. LMG 32999]CAK1232622.1 Threonine dehydrogenase or Mannitol dehydrogenase (mdh) [Fructobacillus sp. LMG 32999]CAK1233737.1 Threonine dehydrogenase or Mannitol dehydrogenase (mdh) [Fructobacillus sp. LMG 32999]